MDYLTWLRKEHELVQGMIVVFKELINKLSKAKAVNLLDLEDVYFFWSGYLEDHYLSWEDEYIFSYLRKIDHPLLARLLQAQEEIRNKINILGVSVRKIRLGRLNSGRELVKNGEDFLWFIEAYLKEEDKIIEELEEKEDDFALAQDISSIPKLEGERLLKQERLLAIVERLSSDYLGRRLSLDCFGQDISLQKSMGQDTALDQKKQEFMPDKDEIKNENGFEEEINNDVAGERAEDYIAIKDEYPAEVQEKESL